MYSLFTLYTDCLYLYISRAHQAIETVPCIGSSNGHVRMLFHQIQDVIHQRKLLCFVGLIRAHSYLPGPIADGNASADKLTQMVVFFQVEQVQ